MYFVCFFMLLCSIRHFWLRSSCIQEKSFSIQERWILYQHFDIIFRSTTSLVSEIYSFMSCHYDVFVCFFMLLCSIRHFWLRSSCIQEKSFSNQERWILYQHSDIIFRSPIKLSFWDIHVYVLSLRCILCVFSCYCARFVIFDCVPVVYKKYPSLYKKDESFPNILHNFQIYNKLSFWDILVYVLSLRCISVFFHVIVLDSSFLTAF